MKFGGAPLGFLVNGVVFGSKEGVAIVLSIVFLESMVYFNSHTDSLGRQ